jgi:hypothetical protein
MTKTMPSTIGVCANASITQPTIGLPATTTNAFGKSRPSSPVLVPPLLSLLPKPAAGTTEIVIKEVTAFHLDDIAPHDFFEVAENHLADG